MMVSPMTYVDPLKFAISNIIDPQIILTYPLIIVFVNYMVVFDRFS
jgi:hypothetical protein